jgi:hypothetical protein
MFGEFFDAVVLGSLYEEMGEINAEPPVRFRAQ